MTPRALFAFAAAALASFSLPVAAEVTEVAENGFVSQHTRIIAAPADQVWQALVEPARFWSPEHSWSGDAANFSLNPRAGGCFCEQLPPGGSVEHMRVIHVAPQQTLRMSGALGPLQAEAVMGTLTVELAEAANGTRVTWTYVVGGFSRLPLSALSGAVDSVMSEQLARLQAAAETGNGLGH